MSKDEKKQVDNSASKPKVDNKKKNFQLPGQNPKPFQKFSAPNKFKGNSSGPGSTFHRGSGR